MINLNRIFTKEYLLSTEEVFQYWYIYGSLFFLILSVAVIAHKILKKRKDYIALKSLDKQLYWYYLMFGFLGLMSVFLRYEKLPVFGNRLTIFIVVGLFLVLNLWLLFFYFRYTKKDILKFRAKARKEKWLRKK